MVAMLEGKRALVTGGHRGISRAIVESFVAAGAHTAILDIEGAKQAAEQIGLGAFGLQCDVRDADSVADAVGEAVGVMGRLDILVNNAGVATLAPLHELSDDEFDRLLGVNLRGTWLAYTHSVPALVSDSGAAIVNIASLAGLAAFPLLGAYSASKAAVVRLTEAMALELSDHGVRANAVCHGFIDTALVQTASVDFRKATGATAQRL